MLINRNQFPHLVERFQQSGGYGFDTETTGLSENDRLFSVILSDSTDSYYFNFNWRPDHLGSPIDESVTLPREWLKKLEPIFENPDSVFFVHNAKFDMRMLGYEGIEILGHIHCTQAIERVLDNALIGYSLAACASRRGMEKDSSVEEYIKKHKLYTKRQIPGKDKIDEQPHYDLVPLPLISKYGAIDGTIVRALGLDQMRRLQELDEFAATNIPKLLKLVENERKLTKTCYRIERAGMPIDIPYVKKALEYTQGESQRLQTEFATRTGLQFQDSPRVLQRAFTGLGIELPLTPTGLPATNKFALEDMDNWLSNLVQDIRHQELLAGTYFSSFMHFQKDGLIHASMWQGGTGTSRFSYSDPNLQNLPKEDEEEDRDKPFLVRRCFVPLADFCIVAIDYKQQEFRLMLDYAGEMELIAQVLAGEDVHEATARFLGITRKFAKTLNFGLLYGMGVAKLARALRISFKEAQELRYVYFQKLPRVRRLIKQVMASALHRRWIYNWNGFRYHLKDDNFAYKFPNYLIQGSGAQVIRVAMVQLDEYIRMHRLRSHMVAQIHDELIFMMHKTELAHLSEFKRIMEGVYKPFHGLTLECSIETSQKSLAKWDMEKFLAA